MAKAIRCYGESNVIPEHIRNQIRPVAHASWHLQQFLKLSFVILQPYVMADAPSFLVWDSDMILIQPYSVLHTDGAVRLISPFL